jgi:hypothetical protein
VDCCTNGTKLAKKIQVAVSIALNCEEYNPSDTAELTTGCMALHCLVVEFCIKTCKEALCYELLNL